MDFVSDTLNLNLITKFKNNLPNLYGDVDVYCDYYPNSDKIRLCFFHAQLFNKALCRLPEHVKIKWDPEIELGDMNTIKNYLVCVARVETPSLLLKTFFNTNTPYLANYHELFCNPKKLKSSEWNLFFFYEVGDAFPSTSADTSKRDKITLLEISFTINEYMIQGTYN